MEPKIVEAVQNKKTIPEISYESQLLYARLKDLQPDEFVSYQEMSDLIGRDVQKYRGHLSTAIRKCRAEHHVIESVRGEGVKRLADAEIIHSSGRFADHVRRGARIAKQKIMSVDYDKLAKAEQVTHNARLSQYGALNFFATPNVSKKLEQKVEEAQKQLPIGKTLEIFK